MLSSLTAIHSVENNRFCETEEIHLAVKKIIIAAYDKTAMSLPNINAVRKFLFTKKNRRIENKPPTQSALKQHTRRAILQSSIWYPCLNTQMNVQSPASFGWQSDPETDVWMPHWADQTFLVKALKELTRCSCKKDCSSNRKCSCSTDRLKCSASCRCSCGI
ncbi:hypothetical protein DPMN_053146 [Dreissena polymorpha]|uniref:CRC domain-containing protein n=1 Tax=Dreissena polymorpha TaxID=45954 RepID=A0A9D4CLK7_DREPO|nr:hypothetical protein DPMN_053146 [Dreissena polymorpha]